MLSGEICTQIQGVDLEERQKRRGAFSAMGLTRGTAWHCGIAEAALSPGCWRLEISQLGPFLETFWKI
jgi:hypothetical protein